MYETRTSFIELSKQHSAFLVALGSALISMFVLVVALDQVKHVQLRREFLISTMCLMLIAFAGAHCMVEVAAFPAYFENFTPNDIVLSDNELWKSQDYRHLAKAFFDASIFVYLTAIGFLQVLRQLARMLQHNQGKGIDRFAMIAQIMFTFIIGCYVILNTAATMSSHQPRFQIGIFSTILIAIASAIVGVMILNRFVKRRKLLWIRASQYVLLVGGGISFAMFLGSLYTNASLNVLEILWKVFIVTLAAVVSLIQDTEVNVLEFHAREDQN